MQPPDRTGASPDEKERRRDANSTGGTGDRACLRLRRDCTISLDRAHDRAGLFVPRRDIVLDGGGPVPTETSRTDRLSAA